MSIGKYKPGDLVRVRSDLILNRGYGGWAVVDSMMKCGGNTYKIRTINRELHSYYLETRGIPFHWTDEMLVPVSREKCKVSSEESNSLIKNSNFMFDLLME